MTLKKTDLAKIMGLKINSKRKAALSPDRFGRQSATVAAKPQVAAAPAPKLVPITCRLPADVVQPLREAAQKHPGGIHGLMTEAARQWLGQSPAAPAPVAQAAAPAKKAAAKKVAAKKVAAKKVVAKKAAPAKKAPAKKVVAKKAPAKKAVAKKAPAKQKGSAR